MYLRSLVLDIIKDCKTWQRYFFMFYFLFLHFRTNTATKAFENLASLLGLSDENNDSCVYIGGCFLLIALTVLLWNRMKLNRIMYLFF